ncbi:MAG: AGE family epimerase/isomerase [Melioribacteraceae bacterium]|nr:AGE family epimerase/isomerase [Melioribacteraceae bacterium]
MNKTEIVTLKNEFENELYGSVIPFWINHSIDNVNGGYYNHLDKDGSIYDKTKNTWLLGRQVWMFSKLFRQNQTEKKYLEIAKIGADFLLNNAKTNEGRVYFSLTEKGAPVSIQRKIFSECFYALGLSEYGKVSGDDRFIKEAKYMMGNIWELIESPEKLGRPVYNGTPKLSSLAIPMIMLNLIEEIAENDFSSYSKEIDSCLKKIRLHYYEGMLIENIGEDGKLHDSSSGRLLNPGHAIEAGWFLIHWAQKLKNKELLNFSSDIIRNTFLRGWDNEFGGIYYFLDIEEKSPIQLEWDMKLWWPHCESLYAFLLLYSITKREDDWKNFIKVKEYTFNKFPDKKNGEWFGYLNRRGEITHRFKGGPYKGCFHVPRALLLSINILEKLTEEN